MFSRFFVAGVSMSFITLLRFITMFCGTNNIYGIFDDIPQIHIECGKYQGTFCENISVPQNVIMDLKNVMFLLILKK
jgi:hypothetical protein